MKRKKSPASGEARLTNFVCANKQTVTESLQELQSGVKTRWELER